MNVHISIKNRLGQAVLIVLGILTLAVSCTEDRGLLTVEYDLDTDGDGILDQLEADAGTDHRNPCDPLQSPNYDGYDPDNLLWSSSDCDQDGVSNGDEVSIDTNPYLNEGEDTDGDGTPDGLEILNGTDKYNPCDPYHGPGFTDYDPDNELWTQGDCDQDGVSNGDERIGGTDPYFDDYDGIDTDGDGIEDELEFQQGTDPEDPCDPQQLAGYQGYDATNAIWAAGDCDQDGISNGDEVAGSTDPYKDNRVYPVADFLPTLSELQLFQGTLSDLTVQSTVLEYSVRTPLFTDYAHKIRSLSIPGGATALFAGEGLLTLPDNTILTETSFYYNDERNPELGRRILETRVLIKQSGSWNIGKYVWNEQQTEAVLDENAQTVPVSWIDDSGTQRSVNYRIPPNVICAQCHNSYGNMQPIGIKASQLNFSYGGSNQLDRLGELGLLIGAPPSGQIGVFPDWSDGSATLEDRARAYLDVNCAHCHQPGGSYNTTYGNEFDLRFDTSFTQSHIDEFKVEIQNRMNSTIPSYFMPYLGTTVLDEEGVDLVNQYISTLE